LPNESDGLLICTNYTILTQTSKARAHH
jgi:hypothetical protein